MSRVTMAGVSRNPLRVALCYRCDDRDGADVYARVAPSGLISLHGVLRAQGFDSRLFNWSRRPLAQAERALREFRPAVIGISHFTYNHASSMGLVQVARRAVPDGWVVAGGAQATFLDELLLTASGGPDAIIRGEGETALLEAVRQRAQGLWRPEALPSLSWLSGGEIRRTPSAALPDDLDPLYPPQRFEALHGIEPTEQFPFLVTSRGCPAHCSFCNSPRFWHRKLRNRSAESVVDEIALLRGKYGFSYFSLRDDTFTAAKQRVGAFCRLLAERKIFVRWNCQSRVNLVDEERLRWMREAGCDQIQFGIESAAPRVLRQLDKAIHLPEIEAALTTCRKVGIKTGAYFITGVPGQTLADVEANFALFEKYGLMDGVVAPLCYYPGTSLFDAARDRGQVDEAIFLAGDPAPLFVRNDREAWLQHRTLAEYIDRRQPDLGFSREELESQLRDQRTFAGELDLAEMQLEQDGPAAAWSRFVEVARDWPECGLAYEGAARALAGSGQSRAARVWKAAARERSFGRSADPVERLPLSADPAPSIGPRGRRSGPKK